MRVLSCFCAQPKSCACFEPSSFTFTTMTASMGSPSADPSIESRPSTTDTDWIGKWCVVLYDDMPFPGIVQDVDDEDFEVKVMHRIGQNRYFWPLLPDILWYKHSKVVCKIQEPLLVGSRHYQLSKKDYQCLLKLLQ